MPKQPKQNGVKEIQIAVRLTAETVRTIDGYAERQSRPGLRVTRADAVRMLLQAGLDTERKK
jgi:hypothetical protein